MLSISSLKSFDVVLPLQTPPHDSSRNRRIFIAKFKSSRLPDVLRRQYKFEPLKIQYVFHAIPADAYEHSKSLIEQLISLHHPGQNPILFQKVLLLAVLASSSRQRDSLICLQHSPSKSVLGQIRALQLDNSS